MEAAYWRYWRDGREGMLSLGTYPKTGLRDARAKRDEARKLLAAGGDPSQARKTDKADRVAKREAQALADAGLPGPGTFEHVARDWLTTVHEANVSAGHAERTRIRLEQDAVFTRNDKPVVMIEYDPLEDGSSWSGRLRYRNLAFNYEMDVLSIRAKP